MQIFSVPENPVPPRATVGALTTSDGVRLRYARWLPTAPRRGTVCVFQGRAEFIEKYFEVVEDLRGRGFAVATLDWRGQGLSQRALSDRRKGYVRRFSDFDLDLEVFVKEVMLPDCPPPYFALAHSMGGAILMRAAHRNRRWFERMVFSAPMLGLVGPAARRGAEITARILRLIGFGGTYVPGGGATAIHSLPFQDNVLTSDPERYARAGAVLAAHPELALGSPTVAWLAGAYAEMAAFAQPSYPRSITQPILIAAAGRDQVVSTQAIEQFAIRLRAGSHVVIPKSQHEILMEQDTIRGQFWAAFDAFVPGTPVF
ncbi:MAG: lysophospholipase [Variibacter sp.]|jgi:lysophospholipase|nr:lysophospholipase [Variibacter sp.]